MFFLVVLSFIYVNNRVVDAIQQSEKERHTREKRAAHIRKKKLDRLYGREE
jgi:hypothetical protein